MSRFCNRVLSLLFIILLISANAFAQKGEANNGDKYFPYLQDDEDMKLAAPAATFKSKGMQIGGWISPIVLDQRQGSDQLTASVNILKLYLKTGLWSDSYLHIRGKDVYSRYLASEGKYGSIEQPENNYDLDLAYIGMMTSNRVARISLGRKYYQIGTGVVLNGRGDGGEVNLDTRYLSLQLLGLYTGLLKKDDNPYKLSSRDITDDAKRIFTGGTLSFHLANQTLYLFGLMQMDKGDEDPATPINYNSQYYGGGLKGVLLGGLSYQGEFIYETGESYLSGSKEKGDIKAYAGIFNLYYFFNATVSPVLIVQYAYGSGDSDRQDARSTDANTSGEDNGFLSFGTYLGGFALRPVLSNIHVYRGGFSLSPFAWAGNFAVRRIAIITKYSLYKKDKAEAPIGDSKAQENSDDLGRGVDVSLKWKIFHDLSFFLNYAVFMPGDAYGSDENDKIKFAMTGLTISF